jgi:carboxylate-amine ligase
VDALAASGTILDTGMVYFDARLSARYPTVEVRVADVCLDPADAVLLAALVRGLAETALAGPVGAAGAAGAGSAGGGAGTRGGSGDAEPRTEVIRVAAWRAARSGLSGELVSPVHGAPVPARQAVQDLVEHVSPALDALGDLGWVRQQVDEVLRRGNGAGQQRAWRAEGADEAEVVRRAVRRTLS